MGDSCVLNSDCDVRQIFINARTPAAGEPLGEDVLIDETANGRAQHRQSHCAGLNGGNPEVLKVTWHHEQVGFRQQAPLLFAADLADEDHVGVLAQSRMQGLREIRAVNADLALADQAPFCLVHENIRSEFSDLDQSDPNAVIIGDAADGFNYANLNRAFQICQQGGPLVGIGRNRYFKLGDELLLDAGPFISAIEYAVTYGQKNYTPWAPPLAPIKIIMGTGVLLMLLQAIATFFKENSHV